MAPRESMAGVFRTAMVLITSVPIAVGLASAEPDDLVPECVGDISLHGLLPAPAGLVETGRIGRVSASDLPELLAERMLVDVRPSAHSTSKPLAGALTMDLQGLRTLARANTRDVLVVGVGDDDGRLATRLATWPESDRIRIVRGGVPAIVMRNDHDGDGQTLADLLSISPARALAAARNGDLLVLSSAQVSTHFLAPDAAIPTTIALDDTGAVQAIEGWLETEDLNIRAGILLVDPDGRQARALAPPLSRSLQTPVFHAAGGKAAIDVHARRFADMNRQSGIPDRGCP